MILQRGDLHHVKGLTTAAAIWLTAAIGLMCGVGELKLAVFATALAIAVLVLDFASEHIWPKPDKPTAKSTEDANRSREDRLT